jgi:NAD(P) transhydrogenase subunit beta
MPIIDADKARWSSRSSAARTPASPGIDNELYFLDKTWMLFGDAKAVVGELVKALSPSAGH